MTFIWQASTLSQRLSRLNMGWSIKECEQ
jgi:hypothetical protein